MQGDAGAPALSSWRGKSLALVAAVLIAAFDLWSKAAVFDALRMHEEYLLAGEWLAFKPVLNPGVMWGQFGNLQPYLPWVRSVAAIVVLVMIATTPAAARRTQLALGLVLGGAIGNIWDGFAVGQVRDFVLVDLGFAPFHPFPIFNVADSAICVGVGLLALGLLLDRPADPAPSPPPSSPS
ncbi:MAG: signal peptidase II [Planctomycetota bacterium]